MNELKELQQKRYDCISEIEKNLDKRDACHIRGTLDKKKVIDNICKKHNLNKYNISIIMQFDYHYARVLFAVNKTFRNYLYTDSEKKYKESLHRFNLVTGKNITKYSIEIAQQAKTDEQLKYRLGMIVNFIKLYLSA